MRTVELPGLTADEALVPVTFTDHGADGLSDAYLLLHGGGGAATVTSFADRLSAALGVRVVAPVHPGFDGTDRAPGVATIADLARLYARLPEALALTSITVVGNSIGGWIAAELGLLAPPEISRLVLVDAVGIEVPGHPVVDFFSLSPAEIASHSYADPGKFGIDPASLSPARRAVMTGNRAVLASYGGASMTDPTLLARLAEIAVPTLVVWGEADRIVDPGYGSAYAAAIPNADYRLLRGTGHLPQVETPDLLIEAIAAVD